MGDLTPYAGSAIKKIAKTINLSAVVIGGILAAPIRETETSTELCGIG